MGPKRPRRFYFPMPRANFGVAMRVKWVVNTAAGACCLTHNQKSYIRFRIVDESVGEAGTGRKSHAVTGLQPLQIAVGPQIGLTLQHEDEFLLISLGMGPGDPPAGHKPFMVDAEPHQAEIIAV